MTDFDAFLFRQQISDGLALAEQLVGLGVTVLSFVLWRFCVVVRARGCSPY